MKKNNKRKIIESGIIGAVIGASAGIAMATESGNKFAKELISNTTKKSKKPTKKQAK